MDRNSQYYFIPLKEPIPLTEQHWPEDVLPLVHTRTMTYMHEDFIKDCIEGLLMQKTTFPVQILIHDDSSTDKTAEIVREYEQKYPCLIKAFYQKENSFTKPDKHERRAEFMSWRIGKYEAICEGDDYWIDPLKLQKQVDFLEKNPDFSLCVSGFKSVNIYTNETEDIVIIPKGVKPQLNGYTFSLYDTRKKWLTKTLTATFRFDSKIVIELLKYKYSRDVNLFYYLLKNGKGFYFTEIMGVYRIHAGGVHSMNQGLINNLAAFYVYNELNTKNNDRFIKRKFLNASLNLLNSKLYSKEKIESISFKYLFCSILKNIRSFNDILHIILKLIFISRNHYCLIKKYLGLKYNKFY